MKMLGHGPNLIIWILIIGGIFYWTLRLNRYRKQAKRNSTIE
jgi:preprotein translocase subunit YajC